jgi:hypothetical protein
MKRLLRVLSFAALVGAFVHGAVGEVGKNALNYAVTWFNDRIEITVKDPNAKKEVAEAKPVVPKQSYDFYPYSDFPTYSDFPVKPSGKRAKPDSYDAYPAKPEKRSSATGGWDTTSYTDFAKPRNYDYFLPDKPGKRSDTYGWYAVSYVDSYPAKN